MSGYIPRGPTAYERKTAADVESQIEDAQTITQSGAMELLSKQESKVLSTLVASFKQGALNDRDAAIGIAVIANLREVQAAAQKVVLRGTQAAEFLTGARK